jgi:autotransporter-associated beta strand protein
MKKILLITLLALGLAQSSRAQANLVWTPTDPNWDLTTSNWVDTSSSLMVPFAQRDNVLFDSTGLGYPAVELGANLLSPNSVVVEVDSPNQYALASTTGGKLTNVFSLTKRGSGTLILDADNVITNAITIEAGTLQIGNGSSRGTLGTGFAGFTAPINNNGTLVFNRTGTLNFSNNVTGSGGLSVQASATSPVINMRGTNNMTGPIVHNGAILNYESSWTLGNPSGIEIVASAANARLQFSYGINVACPILISGATGSSSVRAAIQEWDGTNTVSGQILVGPGTGDGSTKPLVQLITSGPSRPNTQLTVTGNVADQNPADQYAGTFYLRGAAGFGRLYGTVNLPAAAFIKDDASIWTIYSSGNSAAETSVANGWLGLAAANALPNAPLTVGGGSLSGTLDLGGFDQTVGPLRSAPTYTGGVVTNSSSAPALLTLTATAPGGNYYGWIKDSGSTGKVGIKILNPGAPSTQGFYGNCIHSGPTILDFATALALGDNGLPNSTPIEMGNGSTIDLINKTDHTFTLGAGQTLKADGEAHINGNFVNNGTLLLKVRKIDGVVTSDSIKIESGYTVTYGGTLYLELSGDPLGGSDEIKLFTADPGKYSGSFSIVPTTPGPGRTWNTSTLTTDGKLRINSTLPTTPTTLTATVVAGGTELKLEWPLSYTGWALQGQTNAPGAGLTTNWHYLPGSDQVNTVNIPIDPANGSVFFRMVYP